MSEAVAFRPRQSTERSEKPAPVLHAPSLTESSHYSAHPLQISWRRPGAPPAPSSPSPCPRCASSPSSLLSSPRRPTARASWRRVVRPPQPPTTRRRTSTSRRTTRRARRWAFPRFAGALTRLSRRGRWSGGSRGRWVRVRGHGRQPVRREQGVGELPGAPWRGGGVVGGAGQVLQPRQQHVRGGKAVRDVHAGGVAAARRPRAPAEPRSRSVSTTRTATCWGRAPTRAHCSPPVLRGGLPAPEHEQAWCIMVN
jgi:hypothetical protein